MRKNFGAKALLYPMPVLIIGTYDADGNPDAMNAAWGGIADDTKINICLSPSHKTVANLKATGAFTVSVATAQYVAECDYLGIESGNKVADKIAKAGMHVVKSPNVNAPMIEELPMCLECTVISYDDATCRLLGEIVNVNADESVVVDGKIDVAKLAPITYDPSNHAYYKLGDKVGNAFKDGAKFKK
ncbi:MAG: flavin reductase family protein [Bacteroidales bacterium]|nr:flavin reductase family protein [Bacteroidales bacterium]